MERNFKRINNHAWLDGVCSGIAYYIGLPTWLIRLVFILMGVSVFIYILIVILVPSYSKDPDDYEKTSG